MRCADSLVNSPFSRQETVVIALRTPLKYSHSPKTSDHPLNPKPESREPMASIKCTNCGAILKTPTEIAPGKKVKCPKCTQTFVVQAEEEVKPVEEEVEKEEAVD